jgi:hypothetical protein
MYHEVLRHFQDFRRLRVLVIKRRQAATMLGVASPWFLVRYAILRFRYANLRILDLRDYGERSRVCCARQLATGGTVCRQSSWPNPVRPILVYLTHPDYDRVRSLLEILRPTRPDVAIYYANRLGAQDAAQLGKLVGETRPNHTSVVFEAKAAAVSVLQHSRPSRKAGPTPLASRARQLRALD